MGLGFLAVEGERQVAAVARVFAGHAVGQRDALVGRAEQDVEARRRRVDGIGVARGQLGQRGAGVETAGVEEVRALAAGLEGELAEAQGRARSAR